MQLAAGSAMVADGIDLFWGPRTALPLRLDGIATVTTLHDVWDAPKRFRVRSARRAVLNATVRRALRVADHVVCVSERTAVDARRLLGLRSERVSAIHLGVDHQVFRPVEPQRAAAVAGRHGLTTPYVVALDVFRPRKNAENVVRAWALLPPEMRELIQIACLGTLRPGDSAKPFEDVVASCGAARHAHTLGSVSQSDLAALLTGSAALVFPSLQEGFGLPVLEAMACGCPVIASDTSAIPEVAGDAAVLVDPTSPQDIATALQAVLGGKAVSERLREAGRARSALFTWRKAADDHLELFERVLAERPTRIGNQGI